MSVFVRNINISCMPSHRHHFHHHCMPAMPGFMAMNPYYNSVFYGMNLMNMYSWGVATGNNLLSLMGITQPNNFSYQQPIFAQPMINFGYQQPIYTTPVMPYPQFGNIVGSQNIFTPNMTPAPSTTKVEFPQTGYHRTAEKVKKIDWSKLNPFKKKAKISTENKMPELNQVGYDPKKGQALANEVLSHANSKSTGYCARSVKSAIAETGLGSYESGHAYQCADILSQNPNFKEIKVSGNEIDKLPAGCVVVYPQGDAGYSKDFGHVEVALGNGKAASDFVNKHVKDSNNARVFVPVSA